MLRFIQDFEVGGGVPKFGVDAESACFSTSLLGGSGKTFEK